MKTFTDEKGREWAVVLNVTAVKRIRDLAKVDILDATGDVFQRLAGDPVLLCDVLYAACKPEAESKGVTNEQFGEGLAGDALGSAVEALLDELVNFTQPDRRKMVRKILDKANAATQQAVAHFQTVLDGDRMDRILQANLATLDKEIDQKLAALGISSGNVPESSDSTPEPSPSAS